MKNIKSLFYLACISFGVISCSTDYYDNVTSVEITINHEVTKATTLIIGEEYTANLVSIPKNAKNQEVLSSAFFESSAPDVLTVDDSGRLQGLKAGEAILRAFLKEDQSLSAFALISVRKEFQPVTEINFTVDEMTIGVDTSTDLNKLIAVLPSDATDKTVSFVSSNPKLAHINEDGIMQTLNTGDVVITATTTNTSDGTALTAHLKVSIQRRNYNKVFDRSDWTIESSKFEIENNNRGAPENLIDGKNNTCIRLIKAGVDEIFFTVDMGETKKFNFIKITHRDFINEFLDLKEFSLYGAKEDGEFKLIKKDIIMAHRPLEQTFELDAYAEYQKIKVVITKSGGGGSVQIAEFKVGDSFAK